MIEAIQEIDGYESMTPQAIFDQLASNTVEVKDPRGWNIKGIIQFFGDSGANVAGKLELSLGAMAQTGVPFANTSLIALASADGLAVEDDESQALVDAFAAASQTLPEALRWDPEYTATIKSLGVRAEPKYPILTLELVESALQQIAWESWKNGTTGFLNTHINTPHYSLTVATHNQDSDPPTDSELATRLRAMADALESA